MEGLTGDDLPLLISLLKRGVTFVAYSLPEHNYLEYIVDDNESDIISSRRFIVTMWDGTKIEILDRNYRDNFEHIPNKLKGTPISTWCTTSWPDYEDSILKVTEILKSTGGKVVVSRQKTIYDTRFDFAIIAQAIINMFSVYSNAFRAVYYTPQTGAWCVCSPELLLDVDKKTGNLRTVALAGTRPNGMGGEWDEKNMREHNYVVQHIANALTSVGIHPIVGQHETMTTGKIQHILTRISGNILRNGSQINIDEILSVLHPTPAICGYPVAWAKDIISQVEKHNRECYGGYIAIEDQEKYFAHVNLRCFAFRNGVCSFWGGGGIMPDSLAENEWNEASMKIDATLSYIQ